MSMLFHHYKQLTKNVKQVKQIEDKVEGLLSLQPQQQEKIQEEVPTT
jgi:hypothetical protein